MHNIILVYLLSLSSGVRPSVRLCTFVSLVSALVPTVLIRFSWNLCQRFISTISRTSSKTSTPIIFMGVMPLGNANIMENHFLSAITPNFHRIFVKVVSKNYNNNILDEFENQYRSIIFMGVMPLENHFVSVITPTVFIGF